MFKVATEQEEKCFPSLAVEQRLIETVLPKAIRGLRVPSAAKLNNDSHQGKLESLASLDYSADVHALRLHNFQALSILTVGKVLDDAKGILESAISNGEASLEQLKLVQQDISSASVGLVQMQKACRDQVDGSARSLSRALHFHRMAWLESSKLSKETKNELYKSPCDLGISGPTSQPRAFLLGSMGDGILKMV